MWIRLTVCGLLAFAPMRARAQSGGPLVELDNGTVDLGVTLTGEGTLSGNATLQGPVLRVSRAGSKPKSAPAKPDSNQLPINVDHLVVHDGAIVLLGAGTPGRELIRIHHLELTVDHYSNRTGGRQTVISADGRVGREGVVKLRVTAIPGKTDFTGHADLSGLQLDELGALVDQRLGLTPVSGKVSLALQFSVQDGRITGTATPSLTGLALGGGGGANPLGQLSAALPPQVLGNLSDALGGVTGKVPALTTTIPIRGTLQQPRAALWTALAEVLRTSLSQAGNAAFLKAQPRTGS